MSVIINDRDALLQGTFPRSSSSLSKAILLTTTTPVFHVDGAGAGTPGLITAKAILINLDGTILFTTAGGSSIGITATTATLAFSDMIGDTETITAVIVDDGVTYVAETVIGKVIDGPPGVSAARAPVQLSASGYDTWSNSAAEAILVAAGYSTPINRDVITLYDATHSTTKFYDMTGGWLTLDSYLDGNLLVTGTVSADKISTDYLSAIAADIGSITAGDLYSVTLHGGPGYPTSAYAWPTGTVNGGFHLSSAGLLMGNYNANRFFRADSNGDIYTPQFSSVNGVAVFAGALYAVTGTFSGVLTAAAVNAVDTINLKGNAVTVPYASTTYGTTYGNGLTNWLMVASGSIMLKEAGMVYVSTTGLIAYGSGYCSAQSRIDVNGVTVSSGGGADSYQNAVHSAGVYCAAGTVTLQLYFSAADNRARIIDPTIFIQGAYR